MLLVEKLEHGHVEWENDSRQIPSSVIGILCVIPLFRYLDGLKYAYENFGFHPVQV
jgi:hypothetical protein